MKRFFKGFYYAGKGIFRAVKEERNMRFHLCAAVYVYLFSLFYSFTAVQYCILTVLVCGVLALEMMNSAVERAVDKPDKQHDEAAGCAKDMAAGGVLLFCVGCAACGVWLFWDTAAFARIGAFFAVRWWAAVLLALSLAGSAWFVFKKGDK